MSEPPPATILNVNDDEPTRYIVSRILRGADYGVVEAATQREFERHSRTS